MSNYQRLFLFVIVLLALESHAKLQVGEPYTISTRMIDNQMVIKIAGQRLQGSEECGYNLSVSGRIPRKNELIPRIEKSQKFIRLNVIQPSSCNAPYWNFALSADGNIVEDSFLVSDILADRPELIEEFIAGKMHLRLGAQAGAKKYAIINYADFQNEETKINWYSEEHNLNIGTMK